MNPEEIDALLTKAIDTWGIQAQEQMMIEECSELIQALCKIHRARDAAEFEDCARNICEELADVYIMWQQMEKVFNTSENIIGRIYLVKMNRLKERLDGYQKNATSVNITSEE